MIKTQVFCDVRGCNHEVVDRGGALSFRAPGLIKEFHLCGDHWDQVTKDLIPLFKGTSYEKDSMENNPGGNNGLGDLPDRPSTGEKIKPFPRPEELGIS